MEKNETAIARDSALVTGFVSRHYTLRGSIRLHRYSVGWDLLRAPANVVLAPVFLVTRLAALFLGLTGFRRAARWLASLRVSFRSDVSKVIEARIWAEVIEKRDTPIRQRELWQERLVQDYTDVRNAISEIFTALLFLTVGYAVFRAATPGVISLAPVMSEYTATSAAAESFLLGQNLGRLWYQVFPLDISVWYVLLVGITLAAGASMVTTFAGVIADPVQACFGIHRRRLLRLLASLDEEPEAPPKLAREHIFARLADLTDAGMALVRTFRP